MAELSESAQELDRLVAGLARANPEVAFDVWRAGGATELSVETRAAIETQWAHRLTDTEKEPEPPARAAIGRALARFGLDRREGIGLCDQALPDIDWVEIPGGRFIYQGGEHIDIPGFRITRSPVTNAQFQAFIVQDGYANDAWWEGLAERMEGPAEPAWDEGNHPRERVSWYEAVAYTRWLSARLGYGVSIPTEQQWEKAARGTDGREYPWGEGYSPGFANIVETWKKAGPYNLGRTSPVGIYPQGASPYGVQDLSGNVWEWCLNEYGNPANTEYAGDVARVLRGGSWVVISGSARAAYRSGELPGFRYYVVGFRVCCSSSIGESPYTGF